MRISQVEARVLRAPMGEMKAFWAEGFWEEESNSEDESLPSTNRFSKDWENGVRMRPVYPDQIETTIVRVVTDEGIEGVGQCHSPVFPQVSKLIVESVLAPVLLGETPLRTEVLWDKMFATMRQRGHVTGFMMEAISGVDIALWDLKGKAFGKPVCSLLGGPYRTKLRAYQSHLPIYNASQLSNGVQQALELGYSAIQISISGNVSKDIENVTLVRDLVGQDVDIMVDAIASLDLRTAMKLGKQLDELNVLFFEEPLSMENVEGYVELCRAFTMGIAGGEGRYTRHGFKNILERRALDVVQPDIGRAGGISECKKIALLADLQHVTYAPHISIDSAIQTAASLQLAAAIPNFLIFEHWSGRNPLGNDILKRPIPFRNGYVEVPEGPGLGIEIDYDKLETYIVG